MLFRSQETVADITLHVMAPSNWTEPGLWAWSAPDGTNVFSSWPGEAFVDEENGWLTKSIPGWVNSIIINAEGGTVQTIDIPVEAGKDMWIIVNGPDDYILDYEVITSALPEEKPQEVVTAVEPTIAPVKQEVSNEVEPVVNEQEASTQNNTKSVIIIVVVAMAAVIVSFIVVTTKRKQK